MFTGIISDLGEVLDVHEKAEGLRRITVACAYDPDSIAIGASIACSGVCLTVVGRGRAGNRSSFSVDTAAETLRMTTAADWRRGTKLNLERALRLSDELGGHIVSGHIDGVARILGIDAFDGMKRFVIEAPPHLFRFIAFKGSVSLDGTSLTVNEVKADRFSILLIPHTMAVTTWDERQAGDEVNLEVDLMARYAARLLELD
jgi:riboflavin synthase